VQFAMGFGGSPGLSIKSVIKNKNPRKGERDGSYL
jgi:hypothetical protein